jgi:hypothetical protein
MVRKQIFQEILPRVMEEGKLVECVGVSSGGGGNGRFPRF